MAAEADAAGDGGDQRWSDLLPIEQAARRAETELEAALIELEKRAANP
jgi:hypothetical protein